MNDPKLPPMIGTLSTLPEHVQKVVKSYALAAIAINRTTPHTAPVPAESDPMNYKGMFLSAVSALAEIDGLLGLPEDGCNDPQVTVSALKDYIAGCKEVAGYRDQWVDAQYAAASTASPGAPTAVEPPKLGMSMFASVADFEAAKRQTAVEPDERSEFEAWINRGERSPLTVKDDRGGYLDTPTHFRWTGWQARASKGGV